MAKVTKSEKVPKDMQEIFAAVVALTDEFSKHHLDKAKTGEEAQFTEE